MCSLMAVLNPDLANKAQLMRALRHQQRSILSSAAVGLRKCGELYLSQELLRQINSVQDPSELNLTIPSAFETVKPTVKLKLAMSLRVQVRQLKMHQSDTCLRAMRL